MTGPALTSQRPETEEENEEGQEEGEERGDGEVEEEGAKIS